MFGISYDTWKEICEMYFSLHADIHKAYLQWFPFSKLTDEDKTEIAGEDFYNKYIKNGGFVLFPEVMRRSENYIQKTDGSFRKSSLISPILFLVLQAVGKEISIRYVSQRPTDVCVYYAGNYELKHPRYKQDYDAFFKAINARKEQYQYFIKTDIAGFYGNISINALINRINEICNRREQSLSQTTLMLLKELLVYIGDSCFPLIENSMASSYLSTVIYLDNIDCDLYDFIDSKVKDISSFKMIRYVDDLYILFSSEKNFDELIPVFNTVKNAYSSILKQHGLALNTKKCVLRETSEINEELKKSLYDEFVYGNESDIGSFFIGKLQEFLNEIYEVLCDCGITNAKYSGIIEKHFSNDDIEFTPEEVFNYLVYENQTELKQPSVSRKLVQIINQDVSFLSLDPKRLSVMVMQSGSDNAVKAMLNQLFIRSRSGEWNSYDTTIAIAYLIQSKFQHIDLLQVIKANCSELYSYYDNSCKRSFINQIRPVKWNQYLRCIANDVKAVFLFFMSFCEQDKGNYLAGYAYYKNFFDRISADIAFFYVKGSKKKKPDYKQYYCEKKLKSLYRER